MKILKRILAGFTLLLGTAVLLLSLAGGVGVWLVKEPVTERATRLFGRIEAALDVADKNLDPVKKSLARAAERLDSVREKQRKLPQKQEEINPLRRLIARNIAPQIGNAQEKLHTVAEAAVVVNSVLEDVGNIPFLSAAGLDSDRLTQINNRLAEVGPVAWELSRLFAESEGDVGDAGKQVSLVEKALKTMQGLIAEYEPQLTQFRQRTEALKSKTFSWITPAAVIISVACFWIALSQVSVLCHAWSWWKH